MEGLLGEATVLAAQIPEESQLVFNGTVNCVSIDCVAMINEDHFISGAQDG